MLLSFPFRLFLLWKKIGIKGSHSCIVLRVWRCKIWKLILASISLYSLMLENMSRSMRDLEESIRFNGGLPFEFAIFQENCKRRIVLMNNSYALNHFGWYYCAYSQVETMPFMFLLIKDIDTAGCFWLSCKPCWKFRCSVRSICRIKSSPKLPCKLYNFSLSLGQYFEKRLRNRKRGKGRSPILNFDLHGYYIAFVALKSPVRPSRLALVGSIDSVEVDS